MEKNKSILKTLAFTLKFLVETFTFPVECIHHGMDHIQQSLELTKVEEPILDTSLSKPIVNNFFVVKYMIHLKCTSQYEICPQIGLPKPQKSTW